MKSTLLRSLLLAGALTALGLGPAKAQTIQFNATINAAQETTGSDSAAVGWAIMLYHVSSNTFDLTLAINNFPNTLTASHIHEAALGVPGPVVTGLGAEAVYTRSGNTLTATFTNMAYLGTPLTLLQNGAYVNFHTAAWPGGEVRGQLIAQPKRLVAVLKGANEVPANNSQAYGAAYISYNPGTNMITTRLQLYNFTNTLTASHYHEAAVGVPGPVVHGLGGASVYTQTGWSYGAVFTDQTYGGDPIKLLTGGAYLNVHSNVVPGGEIRGQVWTSDEADTPRLVNVSARGWVGTGDQVLIAGFVVTGTEPVRVVVTAKGPSLTSAGVTGALADPILSVHDWTGREIVRNDDYDEGFAAADLAGTGFSPTDDKESALLLVLPPGPYSVVVGGANQSTGIALAEVYEARATGSSWPLARNDSFDGEVHFRQKVNVASTFKPAIKPIEICVGTAPAVALLGK